MATGKKNKYTHEIAINKVAHQPRMNKGYSMWQLEKTNKYTHMKSKHKMIITSLLLCLSAAFVHAQEKTAIEGTVLTVNGEPLSGVSIRVVHDDTGESHFTTTNTEGIFNYPNVTPGNTYDLFFEYVGYAADSLINYRINTPGKNTVMIRLAEQAAELGEVVVVGYGTQRRADVVGALDKVAAEAIQGKPAVNTTQALQGTSPALIIQQRNMEPGGAMNINIRGINSMQDNSPLVVIDGVVGGDINLLNPADIDNVSVLKDAGTAAIYGSRSANGVILITTKSGRRNTPVTVNYNGLVGVQVPNIPYKPVKGYENMILRNQSEINAGNAPVFSPQQIRERQQQGDYEWALYTILKNAIQHNHNISVSGGNERTTFLVSGGYTNQESNLVGPRKGWERYNFRVNMTNTIGKVKLTTNIAYNKSFGKDHSNFTSNLIADARRLPPYYLLKDSLGRYLINDVLTEFSPLGLLEAGGYRNYNNDNILGNFIAAYDITDWLNIRGVFGFDQTANHQVERLMQVNFYPRGTANADRDVWDRNSKGVFYNTQLLLEAKKRFGVHNTSLLLGASNESYNYFANGVHKKFTDPELGIPGDGTVVWTDSYNSLSDNNQNSLNSFFGRASYNYSNKYYGEFSFRFDGSSKFPGYNRWGFFPSISLGYRITNEDFMQAYKQNVGDLKLRGSYGILGNQNIDNYQYIYRYLLYNNAYAFNNIPVGGTGVSPNNPDISWEKSATTNIGIDATFFNRALELSFDYFNRITSDILIPPAVPGTFGATFPDYNAGKLRNEGWEINATYNKAGRLFNHRISFNLGDNKNKVLDFGGNTEIRGAEEMRIILKEGVPFRSYVGYKRDGYIQNLDDVLNAPRPAGLTVGIGDNKYVDYNQDGVINDADLFILGNGFPRLNYGLTYNVTFKGIDLMVFLQGVGKRTAALRGELIEPFHFNYAQIMYKHQLDFWTPFNTDARFPRIAAAGSQSVTNNYRQGSDMYLFDAAYLRVKNIQLGYSLPKTVLDKAKLKGLRAYVSVQNLLTFSKLNFMDPETTEFNNNLINDGANSARAYPTPIYYGFGIDITL